MNRIFRTVIFILILSTISSCASPNKSAQNTTTQSSQKAAVGKSVTELDENIWVVYQDRTDKYWFGSNDSGAYSYDGEDLIQYTIDDGLIANAMRGIEEDRLGNIYFETPNGISKYDGTTFETLEVSQANSNEWKLEPDDLWFNCNASLNDLYRYDGHLLHELTLPRIDLDSAFNTHVDGLSFKDRTYSPYAVFGIDKDTDGILWIGTGEAGAYKYDGNTFLWFGEKELTTLPDGRVPGVRSMLQDKEGNMWLSNFLSKYQVTTIDSVQSYKKLEGIGNLDDFFPERLPYFNSGLSDQNGDLWMTTYTGGVWKLQGNKLLNWKVETATNEALLVTIYEDNHGVIWLGSRNLGVFRFNGEEFVQFDKFADELFKQY